MSPLDTTMSSNHSSRTTKQNTKNSLIFWIFRIMRGRILHWLSQINSGIKDAFESIKSLFVYVYFPWIKTRQEEIDMIEEFRNRKIKKINDPIDIVKNLHSRRVSFQNKYNLIDPWTKRITKRNRENKRGSIHRILIWFSLFLLIFKNFYPTFNQFWPSNLPLCDSWWDVKYILKL